MKTVPRKKIAILLLAASIAACGGSGGSDSAGTPTPGTPTANTVNINAQNMTQYATPHVVTLAATHQTKAAAQPTSECITATNLLVAPSSTVWYMSGSFNINNVCSTPQNLNGTGISLTSGASKDIWNSGNFTIRSFVPWLGSNPDFTASSAGNQLTLTVNNNYAIPAGGNVTVNFGYQQNNTALTQTGMTVAVAGSITPPPPTFATLVLNENSAALASICTQTTACKINVNLMGSDGSLYQTINTITNSTTENTPYTVANIPPGLYTLAATNLPTSPATKVTFTPSSLQLAGGQAATATAQFSVVNPGNTCLSAQMGSINNGAWWMSGSFNIINSCTTPQPISGAQIEMASAGAKLNSAKLQINSTSPWISNFATITGMGNAILLTVNTSSITLPANGGSLNVSFGYDPAGTLLSGVSATVNGGTPITPASLSVNFDTSGLASLCTTSSPCNIPLILSGQSGQFNQTLATVTNTTGNTTFNITGLNPGTYTLSTGTLPANVIATYSSTSITLASGETDAAMALTLTLKPVTTGVLNFTINNPAPNLFSAQSMPVTLQPTSGGSAVNIQANFGQLTSATLNAGSYTLSSVTGLASASQGVYDALQPVTSSVTVNGTSTVTPVWVGNTNLVNQPFAVSGLNSGDSATLTFTDNNYTYNQETVTATSGSQAIQALYKFPAGDIVTVNVKTNSSYQSVAPFTITIPSGSSGQTYTINLTAQTQPTQQIVGYFETWLATATWSGSTYSISGIPSYVGIIPLAFAKPDSTYVAGSLNLASAGLGIAATPSVAIDAIKLAQAKGQKMLLSVGGATYPNFGAFNLQATMALVQDLGLDGVDLDYESNTNGCNNLNTTKLSCPTDTQMINIINQLRAGLDNLSVSMNKRMYLTAAVWSIGAYGSPSYPTTTYGPVGSMSAIWINPLLQVGSKFDALFLMAYDAGNTVTTGYNPIDALKAYQTLYKGPIYLGIEVPPEAWGGNISTPAQTLAEITQAAQLGAAGTMIWALQVQGNAGAGTVNANSYLKPICSLYNLPNCTQSIPLN